MIGPLQLIFLRKYKKNYEILTSILHRMEKITRLQYISQNQTMVFQKIGSEEFGWILHMEEHFENGWKNVLRR